MANSMLRRDFENKLKITYPVLYNLFEEGDEEFLRKIEICKNNDKEHFPFGELFDYLEKNEHLHEFWLL